jgi:hypothetical protein
MKRINKYSNLYNIVDNDYIEDWLYGSVLGFTRRCIRYNDYGIFLRKFYKK